jgi:formylglycine-generating enzyme required for sulfatase activity
MTDPAHLPSIWRSGRLAGFGTLAPALAAVVGAGALVLACSSGGGETPVADAGADTSVPTPDAGPPVVDAGPADTGPVGCGVGFAAKCGVGEICGKDADCTTSNCVGSVCKSASCTDAKRDGDEVGIDCGGSCAQKCDGEACAVDGDCKSRICLNLVCKPSGTKTCGVGAVVLCTNGALCEQDKDCSSLYCSGNICAAPDAASHQDGRANAGETGVDCGGVVKATAPCAAGQVCVDSTDCVGACNANKTCDAPGPNDGKKNNGETDVDCGGPNAPKCAPGKACAAATDCFGSYCPAGGKCVAPTHGDGVKNAGETDVDCGGAALVDGPINLPAAAKCALTKSCTADSDCTSTVCNAVTKTCVQARSCGAGTAGVTTCGQKEVGDANKVHDSCCTSLPLPTRNTKRLDKYEITAGRFRNFIASNGTNVKQFVQNYIAANPASQLKAFTAINPGVVDLYPTTDATDVPVNLVAQMGAITMDNYDGIRGCYNWYDVNNPDNGAYGHAAYWQPAAALAGYGVPPRITPKDDLDAKSLNCVTPMMLAAFCAWDGGELATLADFQDAWGATTFPWGNADIQRPNYNWCNSAVGENLGGFGCGAGIFYEYPLVNRARDIAGRFAAPGRFPLDLSTNKVNGEGWYDLYGNLAEYTGDFSASGNTFCDYSAGPAQGGPACSRANQNGQQGTLRLSNVPRSGIVGVSFEGHQYGRGTTSGFAATFQYGKFGGRCVRPL